MVLKTCTAWKLENVRRVCTIAGVRSRKQELPIAASGLVHGWSSAVLADADGDCIRAATTMPAHRTLSTATLVHFGISDISIRSSLHARGLSIFLIISFALIGVSCLL